MQNHGTWLNDFHFFFRNDAFLDSYAESWYLIEWFSLFLWENDAFLDSYAES